MGKNKNHRSHEQSTTENAPGQQGEKTHRAQTETLHSQVSQKAAPVGPGHDPADIREHNDTGKDRLFEGRQQHDDAEKNSEKTRLAKDVDKHNHDADGAAAKHGGASAKRKN
ncbi:MAG: hypothetical protein H7Z74_15835 [Anaerolineae bacterium]|nr:hypothetical protein [Gemmatimonadaceae bacterium]